MYDGKIIARRYLPQCLSVLDLALGQLCLAMLPEQLSVRYPGDSSVIERSSRHTYVLGILLFRHVLWKVQIHWVPLFMMILDDQPIQS